MNIRYIGPNFELAPNAETGDGKFELVTVEENSRQELKDYIKSLLHNSPKPSVEKFLNSRKVKEVRIKWKGRDVHIDDEKIENYNGEEIQATNRQGKFTFLKPQ